MVDRLGTTTQMRTCFHLASSSLVSVEVGVAANYKKFNYISFSCRGKGVVGACYMLLVSVDYINLKVSYLLNGILHFQSKILLFSFCQFVRRKQCVKGLAPSSDGSA